MTALALGITIAAAGPARADDGAGLVRVSVSGDGGQGNGASSRPSISGDGRFVAFGSLASNLVPDDYDTTSDIFVKELATGRLSHIGSGFLPSMSADGRYTAFFNGGNVAVHDREEGTLTTVSVATDGTPGNGAVSHVDLSADGRHVVFSSTATTLVPGATGTNRKVFVRDLEAGTTTEVSVRPDGVSGSKDSGPATISADGRFVAFASQAKELVAGGRVQHVNALYVRDLLTGVTRRLNSGNVKGYPTISDDGRYVAFADSSSALVAGDTNRVTDVFRYDLATDELVRVNVAADGGEADGDSNYVPQPVPMSADGRFVLFESGATNLVAGDTNGRRDVFVRDMESGVTGRVSGNSTAGAATAANYAGSLSADGGTAVFYSELGLLAEDTNQRSDVYLSGPVVTPAG